MHPGLLRRQQLQGPTEPSPSPPPLAGTTGWGCHPWVLLPLPRRLLQQRQQLLEVALVQGVLPPAQGAPLLLPSQVLLVQHRCFCCCCRQRVVVAAQLAPPPVSPLLG
jgi:hypothetical protein